MRKTITFIKKKYSAAIRKCTVTLHKTVNVDDAAEHARKRTAQRANVKSSRAVAHASQMLMSRITLFFVKKPKS